MSQQIGGYNYLCCGGNPWDDIFGSGAQAEVDQQPTGQDMKQVQDWNNPFSQYPNQGVSTPTPSYNQQESRGAESPTRSMNSQNRSVPNSPVHGQTTMEDASVVHSVGSGTLGSGATRRTATSMKSEVEEEDLTDTDRRRKIVAKHKALKLQQRLMNGDGVAIIKEKKPKEENERVIAAKRTKEAIVLLGKTETTRKKKEQTGEDVRDPETISGMKNHYDLERELTARRRSQQMLDYNEFTSISLIPSLGAYTGMEENKHGKNLKPFC